MSDGSRSRSRSGDRAPPVRPNQEEIDRRVAALNVEMERVMDLPFDNPASPWYGIHGPVAQPSDSDEDEPEPPDELPTPRSIHDIPHCFRLDCERFTGLTLQEWFDQDEFEGMNFFQRWCEFLEMLNDNRERGGYER